jgi:hypothetical protein
VPVGEGGRWALLPLGACLVALVVLGLAVPAPVERLLLGIAEIITP